MKKIILYILLFLSFSCENLLYEADDSIGIIDNEEELIEAIDGVYGLLKEVYSFDYYNITNIKSDALNIKPNYGSHTSGGCSFGIGGNRWDIVEINNTVYERFYKTIVSDNNLITQFEHTENSNLENICLGEALFIRALCYFYLTRFFAEIPVVKDIDVNYSIRKSSVSEVYKAIEKDLFNAIQLLPYTNNEARIPFVTISKGTAKAILAEVYLTMGGYPLHQTEKYEQAAIITGNLIDSAAFYGFGLEEDFVDLWKNENSNSKEKLLGLSLNSDIYSSSLQISGNVNYKYHMNALGDIIPEMSFYNAFPRNYRKQTTFYTGYFVHHEFEVEGENYEWYELVELDPAEFCDFMDFIRYRKYILDASNHPAGIYLLRYAHVLLTYAEAKARSNQLDESAFKAVNKIRRRANKLPLEVPSEYDLSTELSVEQFIDSVVWERAWEFCLETEGRWFDIIRLELLDEVVAARESKEPEVPWFNHNNVDDYFSPIPQEDLWLNPNLQDSLNIE